MIYVMIVTMVALLRSFVAYNIADLGKEKVKKERELLELKKEVARLDDEFIGNNDSKRMEEAARAEGIDVPNSPEYINLNK